ncbi:MAG: hypothetical protein KDI60_08610, partial [Xanthomonadales bacterium]|nr:hypothetical protein [Xanthomonadales bacterium]
MRFITGGIGAALLLALAGCASTAPRAATEVVIAPPTDEQAVSRLYDRIGLATSRYQGGLELIRSGRPRDGRTDMREALADIEDAALRCADTPGCDGDRFVGALVVLVRLQSVAAGWDDYTDEAEDIPESRPTDLDTPMTLPQVERSVRLLRGKDLRDLITLNEPVRAALEDWLT